jgi:DNA polymerase elongation subunit (family B)
MTGAPAKVALFDIETTPNLGYTWGKWQQDVIEFKEDWYMLSFAFRWLGQKKIHTHALPDYAGYDPKTRNDKKLVETLWEVLDEADMVVTHNGDRFDIKKANARFISHGLVPPSPFKSVDTLKIARKHFKFDSNKLDELGKYLGLGRKLPHTGKHLWFGCMAGDAKCWRIMRRYNAQDVELLERVYMKMRPWATTHPDMTMWSRKGSCPACESHNIQHRGWHVNKRGKKPRFQCQDCGKWS